MQRGVKITFAFVLGVLIIGVVGFQSYMGIQRANATNQWVIHTHEVLENLEQVESRLKDAETGQRGFILTGEERYLEPYNAAAGEILKNLNTVAAITKDNPEQQASLLQLQKLSREKLDEIKETIAIRRRGDMEACLNIIRTDRGKQIMDETRAIVAQMVGRERRLLDTRNKSYRETARRATVFLGLGVLLSLALLGIAAVIIVRMLRAVSETPKPGSAGAGWPKIALRYTFAVAAVGASVAIRWWMQRTFGPMPPFIVFYPGILLVASVAGGGPGILMTLLSVLVADYWYFPPYGQFSISSPNDALALGIFAGSSLALSILAERMRRAWWAEAVSATQEKELALLNMGNLMALDLDHHIVRWSEGNHRLYGFDADEAQGRLTYQLLRTEFDRPLEEIHQELEARNHWEGEVRRRSKDGTPMSIALLWALRRDEKGNPLSILEVSTDLTDQKAAEESLRQQAEELAQQNEELSQQSEELAQQAEELAEQNEELQNQSEEIYALNADLTYRESMLQMLLDMARFPIGEREVLAKICHAAMEMTGPTTAGVVVCEKQGDELHILAHTGFDGAETPAAWPVKGSCIEMVMQRDSTVTLEDTALHPDVDILKIPGRPPLAAVLSAPLRVDCKPVGALSVYSATPRQWTAEQIVLIEWLAAQCSHTIEALRLAAEVVQGQEQNKFLAGILEASSQAFGVGYPDGRLGLINRAFERLTGYSGDELRSINWAKALTPPEWRDPESEKLEELRRTGRPVRYEKEYIRKDGTRVPIELLVHVAVNALGEPLYYYSFITDISDRKTAERRLSESRERLDLALNSARMAPFEWDIVNNKRHWDATVHELLGTNADSFDGSSEAFFRIIHPDDRGAVQKALAKALENGVPYETEYRAIWSDDSVHYIAARGKVHRDDAGRANWMTGLCWDITEQKRIEEALRASRAKLEAALASMTDAVFISDTEGRFVEFNDAFATFHRFETRDECARTFAEYPDILDVFMADGTPAPVDMWAVPRALRGETATNAEYSLRRKDTGETWVGSYSFGPIRDADGAIVGSVVAGRDITESKRAESDLRRIVQELSRSNQDLEHFAYVASHDLQEPLRTVRAYAQLLHKRYKGKMDHDADEFINFVVDGAGRMQSLILDLLAYSRVSSAPRELNLTDSATSLTHALAAIRRTLENTDALVTNDPLPTLVADGKQLTQVFQNLIVNAIKFRRKGSRPLIHIAAREEEKEWVFSVADNGIGIDPQYHDKVFVIFQRLHGPGEYPGTGIGLTICKRIVERHGGRIWFESTPDEGTTFFFSLRK